MTLAQAIWSGCFRSLQFSGRASRPEYWYFLLPGLGLFALAILAIRASYPEMRGAAVLAAAAPFLLPLAAVTARRLTDAGFDRREMTMPLSALVGFLISLNLLQPFYTAFAQGMTEADGPSGFALFLIGGPILLLVAVVTLSQFLAGFFTGITLFGMMVLPSKPNPDRYGRNPTEVQS